ncbi:hypothetical protein [Micromonospora chokoriensis]|uniref:hypothetical protein n=1 Tax=Micromonospora chokoriensis TaxID=356851 RepID=UPI0012FDE1F6|nr:hypothetical protein [Micromonospora chokoriensis]
MRRLSVPSIEAAFVVFDARRSVRRRASTGPRLALGGIPTAGRVMRRRLALGGILTAGRY